MNDDLKREARLRQTLSALVDGEAHVNPTKPISCAVSPRPSPRAPV